MQKSCLFSFVSFSFAYELADENRNIEEEEENGQTDKNLL